MGGVVRWGARWLSASVLERYSVAILAKPLVGARTPLAVRHFLPPTLGGGASSPPSPGIQLSRAWAARPPGPRSKNRGSRDRGEPRRGEGQEEQCMAHIPPVTTHGGLKPGPWERGQWERSHDSAP